MVGHSQPGQGLLEVAGDDPRQDTSGWRGYRQLVSEAHFENPKSAKLVFSIHDIGHEINYWDGFNRVMVNELGANRIAIPLRAAETAPRGCQMDLPRMCGLVLIADHPSESFVLYLDALHLE